MGWKKLVTWVAIISPDSMIVCEATGGYERRMLRAFQQAQYRTCVVQPYSELDSENRARG